MVRYDKNGEALHVGEFVRGDGRYVYKHTHDGHQHVIYAHSLNELRFKEREFLALNPERVYATEPEYKVFKVDDIAAVSFCLTCDVKNAEAFCYFISDGTHVKIGKAKDVQARMINLQNANSNALKVICTFPCESEAAAHVLEKRLHRFFGEFRITGEWFDILYRIDTLAVHDRFGALLNKKNV